jgi:U32 family peptidase
MKKYELLAPAGNFAMFSSAVEAGADAIYFGLEEFSMRAAAKNFKISDLKKLKEICNSSPRKPKMYLTLNTIIYDSEIKNLEKIFKKIKNKIDAIICWDFSVISLCKKYKIPFFISTQASVSNTKSAEFYKKIGAKRIVLARELNLQQIKKISKLIEIEAFVHGAMCVSISGRCFTSQFLFCKSANRGKCLHPCRRSYIVKDKQEGYELEIENDKIFSAKDLCMLPYIQEMKKAGITCFKIEGRNRDPRYVNTVVKVYRKALDKKLTKKEIKTSMEELEKVYNKKFSTGFYLGKPTPKDFSDIEHNASKEKKHFIGKIIHYFDKLEVITIKLVSRVKIGEKIIVIGKNTGVKEFYLNSMQFKGKNVKSGKKGDEIGIKTPFKLKKNDEVYIIKKN